MASRQRDRRKRQRLQPLLYVVGRSIVAVCAVLMIWAGLQYMLGEVVRIAFRPSPPANPIHAAPAPAVRPARSLRSDGEVTAAMAPRRAPAGAGRGVRSGLNSKPKR